VDADNKKKARINCIAHLLSKIDYKEIEKPSIELPDRQPDDTYERPPMEEQNFVPNYAEKVIKAENA
jgi:hypothetical protein